MLLVVALLGVAAGCGGGDERPTVAEFEQNVVTTRDRVDFAFARIPKGQSKEEVLDRMDEASAAIADASASFEDGGAPEVFEDEAEKLATSLDQLALDLQATAHDIRQPELGLELPAGFEFESWNDANEALAAMLGDGLDVELLGRH
jgi:hypothetical protein